MHKYGQSVQNIWRYVICSIVSNTAHPGERGSIFIVLHYAATSEVSTVTLKEQLRFIFDYQQLLMWYDTRCEQWFYLETIYLSQVFPTTVDRFSLYAVLFLYLYTFLVLWQFEASAILGTGLATIDPRRPDWLTTCIRMSVLRHRLTIFCHMSRNLRVCKRERCVPVSERVHVCSEASDIQRKHPFPKRMVQTQIRSICFNTFLNDWNFGFDDKTRDNLAR